MKLGRRGWRIPLASVEAYEARHTTEPESAPELSIPRRATPPVRETAADLAGRYEPVFRGPVPWRLEVIEAAQPAAGRGRAAGRKKAASQRH